jgi:3,4-dihydroxy 2-butanone 4-phosphate synthase / GTP cyclohydrolase II
MISTLEEALAALTNGQFVIVADDENRENEGDLILAAEKATPWNHLPSDERRTSGRTAPSSNGSS